MILEGRSLIETILEDCQEEQNYKDFGFVLLFIYLYYWLIWYTCKMLKKLIYQQCVTRLSVPQEEKQLLS